MKPYAIPALVMASLCFMVALNESLILYRRGFKPRDVAFIAISLGGFFYNLFCAGEYDVDLPLQSIAWCRAEIVALLLTGLGLLWYVSEVTGLVKRRFLLAYAVWTALGVLSQALNLGDLTWIASRPFVQTVRLPFGLEFVYREVEQGIVIDILDVAGSLLLAWLILLAVRHGRAGHRREARSLLAVLAILTAAYLSDEAVGAGLYSFIYLTDYAWLAFIALVAIRRTNERRAFALAEQNLLKSEDRLEDSRATLKAIVDSTSDLIWSVDATTFGLLTFNEGLRRYFQERRGLRLEPGMRPEDTAATPESVRTWRGFYRRALAEGPYSEEYHEQPGSPLLHLNFNVLRKDDRVFGLSVFGKDITESRNAEETIRRSLEEKEILLRELYHRTKNNMALIIALLGLQASQVDDPGVSSALSDAQNRIRSIALVHERLYEARDLSHVDLKDYITELVSVLSESYGVSSGRIAIVLELEPVSVLFDSAIPCGLVLNELITNALRHAFPGDRAVSIRIGLNRAADGLIRLDVADDGIGAPSDFDFRSSGRFGVQNTFSLIESQLRGSVSLDASAGLAWRIEFRDNRYSPRV